MGTKIPLILWNTKSQSGKKMKSWSNTIWWKFNFNILLQFSIKALKVKKNLSPYKVFILIIDLSSFLPGLLFRWEFTVIDYRESRWSSEFHPRTLVWLQSRINHRAITPTYSLPFMNARQTSKLISKKQIKQRIRFRLDFKTTFILK